MKCENCKWWTPVGRKDKEGVWKQDKDDRNLGIGWCQKNPPIFIKEDNLSNWPKTQEHQSCGSHENILTPLEEARQESSKQRYKNWEKLREIWDLNKDIRDTGEKLGISRKKSPQRILKLICEKHNGEEKKEQKVKVK